MPERHVEFSRSFSKTFRKADTKIQQAFERRLDMFLQNPNHPQLQNHALIGKLGSYRSINVTGDWRAIFSEQGERATFVALGTHSQLYK